MGDNKAKEELIRRLKEGNFDGIESILEQLGDVNMLVMVIQSNVKPEILEEFYERAIKYYESRPQSESLVRNCKFYREFLRARTPK